MFSSAAPALFKAGFRRQLTFRQAMWAGMLSTFTFGIVRFMVIHSLYRHRAVVSGLSYRDAVSWVVLSNALFAIAWTPWVAEYSRVIRSGDVLGEMLRPFNPFLYQLFQQLGRLCAQLLVAMLPIFLFIAAAVRPQAPHGVQGWMLSLISIGFFILAGFALNFLVGCTAFFTADWYTWGSFSFYVLLLFGGFLLPVEYYSGTLGVIVRYGPGMAFVASTVRVVNNIHPIESLFVQAIWVAILMSVAYSFHYFGRRKLVIFGG